MGSTPGPRFEYENQLHGLMSHIDDDVIEYTDLQELLNTCGNGQLSKLMEVFSKCIAEIRQLVDRVVNHYAIILLTYGYAFNDKRQKWKPDSFLATVQTQPHMPFTPDYAYSNGSDAPMIPLTALGSGDELNAAAVILPVLHDLSLFTDQCFKTVLHTLTELDRYLSVAGYSTIPNRELMPDLPPNIRFDAIPQALMDLFVVLINIDAIIAQHSQLSNDIRAIKRAVQTLLLNPSLLEMDNEQVEKLRSLERFIQVFESNLINPNRTIFGQCVEAIQSSKFGSPKQANRLIGHFEGFIKQYTLAGSDNNSLCVRFSEDREFLGLMALFIVYIGLFRREDKKLLKLIIDYQKRYSIYVVHLQGNCHIHPEQFLYDNLPKSMVQKSYLDSARSQRESLITRCTLDRSLQLFAQKITPWMVDFENDVRNDKIFSENYMQTLEVRIRLFLSGIKLLAKASYHVKSYISYHLDRETPITKPNLVTLLKLISLIKAVQLSFERNKAFVQDSIIRLNQLRSTRLLKLMSNIRKNILSQMSEHSDRKLDMISTIILASNCVNGSMLTAPRQLLVSLCLSIIGSSISAQDLSRINDYSQSFRLNIFERLRTHADCSYLFWSLPTFGAYFNHCFEENPCNINELRYFFMALSDIRVLFTVPEWANDYCVDITDSLSKSIDDIRAAGDEFLSLVKKDVHEQFKNDFIDKVCQEFETELRLQTHRGLQLDDQNPFKRHLYDFKTIFNSPPLRLFDQLICVKSCVENHLNRISYDLTSIALHDWYTYDSMMNLARHNYGLKFVSTQLPTQTIEQGLDVLDITRNLASFVTLYDYNLYNQMFVEHVTMSLVQQGNNSKSQVNILLIHHVANSIQTHGYGIISTAVNMAYRLVRKQLATFSRFLNEDHVRLRLRKEARYMKDLIEHPEVSRNIHNRYPFQRAEKVVYSLKKFGLTPTNQTYLDALRTVITCIGNALGFVRMLRSGALNCTSKSVNFLPDFDDLNDMRLTEYVKQESFGLHVIEAAENFDALMDNLNKNFSSSTNYFALLVSVFSERISAEKSKQDTKLQQNFSNFHVLLPALTINFVHHIVSSKDRLSSRIASNDRLIGGSISDDGFAMGVAFVLVIFNEWSRFNGLQWFEEVSHEIATDRMNVTDKANDNTRQTCTMTIKRLDTLEREFSQLKYSLISAKVLFKCPPTVDKTDENFQSRNSNLPHNSGSGTPESDSNAHVMETLS
ncbi:WASH complex subunit 4, partial [Fragariocoptes setiger]